MGKVIDITKTYAELCGQTKILWVTGGSSDSGAACLDVALATFGERTVGRREPPR